MKQLLQDFLNLFFPDCCYSCQGILLAREKSICTSCRANLPFTHIHKLNPEQNPVCQKFFGKIPIRFGLAFLKFTKSGKVQRMLHQIKYQNQPELAQILGEWYSSELQSTSLQSAFDVIIPVPLHPKKLKIRGYNQSEYFGRGLVKYLSSIFEPSALVRTTATATQTKKSRLERWENVARVFEVAKPELVRNKHILLVDDVITTGSTLEACGQALLEAEALSVSVAAIAMA
ncbi:MAG: ComF family protein [Raineya sp.]|nr:ComF family protein [Raineya sp.]